MRTYVVLVALFSACFLSAQEDFSVVQVMGFCAHFREYDKFNIDIVFGENKDKCDPAIGFISIEDQKIHFAESLALKNISFEDFGLNLTGSFAKNDDFTRIEAYNYITQDTTEIAYIAKVAEEQFIEVSNVGNPRQLDDFTTQDKAAICAIEDATKRAQLIADHLGYKNCDLVSVDDDTTSRNYTATYIIMQAFRRKKSLTSGYPSAYSIIGNYKMY